MEKYYKQYDACRQLEQPFCSMACPFHVDVLDFQSKMANSNYNAAFKAFRNAVAFPDIVAALCPEYCASVCPRKGSGSVCSAESSGKDMRDESNKKGSDGLQCSNEGQKNRRDRSGNQRPSLCRAAGSEKNTTSRFMKRREGWAVNFGKCCLQRFFLRISSVSFNLKNMLCI